MTWPRIETPDEIVTVGVGRPLEEALSAAFREMIHWVKELTGLTTQEAYALIGIAGHARPGQGSGRTLLDALHPATSALAGLALIGSWPMTVQKEGDGVDLPSPSSPQSELPGQTVATIPLE
jgi:hypothetical protein